MEHPASHGSDEASGGRGESWEDFRASDAERERVVAVLRRQFTTGRLSFEELGERLDAALSARTLGELYALTADLPHVAGPHPVLDDAPARLAPAARPRPVAVGIAGLAGTAAVLVLIWAATGAGGFWPLWAIVAIVLAVAAGGATRHRRRR